MRVSKPGSAKVGLSCHSQTSPHSAVQASCLELQGTSVRFLSLADTHLGRSQASPSLPHFSCCFCGLSGYAWFCCRALKLPEVSLIGTVRSTTTRVNLHCQLDWIRKTWKHSPDCVLESFPKVSLRRLNVGGAITWLEPQSK